MNTATRHELFWRWLLALGCFLLLVYFFSPPWAAFRAWSRAPELGGLIELRRGVSVLQQEAHPGTRLPDVLHGAIQWRLLFPLVGHVLGLPPEALFGCAEVGVVLALAFIITVLRRRGVGFFDAALATVILGAGSWYFASVRWLGYYDSWLVLGLLLVAFARTRWPGWLACLWAPWVDERFVLAAPLALLCRYLLRARDGQAGAGRAFWREELAVPAGLLAAFVVVRLGWLSRYSDANATVAGYLSGLHLAGTPWSRVAFGVWEGLRVGWIFVAAAAGLLAGRRIQALAVAIAVVGLVVVGLVTAQDFSRSMMLVLPAGLLGLLLAFEARPRWLPRTLWIGAGAALLLPAHLVMSDTVSPLAGLYQELAGLRSPPPSVMSEMYELRGILGMEAGKFAQAEADLTLAMQLADNPANAAKHRGLLYASAGRWSDARRDFDLAIKRDPQNPDAWCLRAQAEFALGDTQAAQADMRHALSIAPNDWAQRPDVTRFLERLRRAMPAG